MINHGELSDGRARQAQTDHARESAEVAMEAVVASIVATGMAKRYLVEGSPFFPDGATMIIAALSAIYFLHAAINKKPCTVKGSGS